MRKTPVLSALGLLAAGTVALTGCSGSTAAAPNAAVATAAAIDSCVPADTTIDVTFGQQASEAMTIAVSALQEQHPGLTVNAVPAQTTSYDDLTKSIVADIAVGKRPDLIMTGLGQLKFWVDTYQPAPIDTAALPETYKTQFLDAGTVDGTVYLAPGQISTPVLLVNQDALTAAGGGDAADIATLDDLVAAAEKVTAETGEPSISVPTQGLPDWFAQAFVQGAGESFVNDDGTAGFGTDTAVDALSIWQRLSADDLEMGVGDTDAMAAFQSGNAAFLVYTTSTIATIQKGIGDSFDWSAVDLPTLTGEKEGPLPAGGNGWVVLSEDGCRAAYANALVGELLSPAAVAGASGTSYSYIPVDTTAGEELLASDAATDQLTYAWSYDQALSPWGGFAGDKTVQVNDLIRTMAQKLQTGADTAETVQQTVSSIDALVGTEK